MSGTQISPRMEVEPLWRTFYADPHLKFTIEFDLTGHILMQIYADVCACTDNAGSNPITLGNLYLNPMREHQSYSAGKRYVEMVIPLSKSAIETIEEQRGKNHYHNVNMMVRGHMNVLFAEIGLAGRAGARNLDLRPTSSNPMGTYRFGETVEIKASEWTDKYLEALGLGKYLSIEIPMNLDDVLKRVEDAEEKALAERIVESAKLLIDAQKSMNSGDWEQTVADTRLALECLEKGKVIYQEEELSMTKALQKLLTRIGFPQQVNEATTRMIDNLHAFTNPPHHVQVNEKKIITKTPFDKTDAQFVLGTLTLLLSMLTKKLIKREIG